MEVVIEYFADVVNLGLAFVAVVRCCLLGCFVAVVGLAGMECREMNF